MYKNDTIFMVIFLSVQNPVNLRMDECSSLNENKTFRETFTMLGLVRLLNCGGGGGGGARIGEPSSVAGVVVGVLARGVSSDKEGGTRRLGSKVWREVL